MIFMLPQTEFVVLLTDFAHNPHTCRKQLYKNASKQNYLQDYYYHS